MTEKKITSEVEELSRELKVNLPSGSLPIVIKIIALFTLLGGLSIAGSVFVDIVGESLSFLNYLLRLAVGALAILIAHGIIRKRRWAIWLYGLLVILEILSNPIAAIIPAVILVYLYFHRHLFAESFLDKFVKKLLGKLKKI